jgi:hypothetical protein
VPHLQTPMESYKLAFKFFVEDASLLTGHEFVPLLHKWIQQHKVADHLSIDVADYEHVHNGPGTLLITHEANFAMDRADGRLGLLYVRKQPIASASNFPQRLRAVARPVLEAAQRLEEDLPGKIKFRTDEFAFRIYDRLLGPNTSETFAAVKSDLESFVKDLYGSTPSSLDFHPSLQSLFEVTVKAPASPEIATLLERLGAGAPARS